MNAAIHVAGWTLVHFAWQGALVALAAAIALRLLRHATPQSRYAVGCLALAAMLVLPGATAWRLTSAPADADRWRRCAAPCSCASRPSRPRRTRIGSSSASAARPRER
jgi:hypothetical protein